MRTLPFPGSGIMVLSVMTAVIDLCVPQTKRDFVCAPKAANR